MTVDVAEVRGVPVAHVAGVLDVTSADDLASAVLKILPNAAPGLIVDLTELTHLDSAGLRVLFRTARRLEERQQQLRLVVRPDTLVEDLLSANDVGAYAPLDNALDDAVAELVRPA